MIKRKKRYVTYYDGTLDDEALDPELASPDRDGLMSKEDKILLDKLVDNNSPITINANNVICDSEHRFVTDTEKVVWNSKAPNTLATTTTAGLMSAQDKSLLESLTGGNGNTIQVSATNVICDSEHRFVTDTLIAKIESVPSVYDQNIFSFNSDGSLNIKGFNEAEAGAQLVKGADGKVVWVKPAVTVEEIQTTINQIQNDMTNLTSIVNNKADVTTVEVLETNVSQIKTDVIDLTSIVNNKADATTVQVLQTDVTQIKTDVTELTSIVNNKADSTSVYTKQEVDLAISNSIASVNHLQRKKVNDVSEIDPSAQNAENYIYMITKNDESSEDHFDEYMVIDGSLEKVGNWSVDLTEYVKTADMNSALDSKVDKVEGKGLSTHDLTDELLAKINASAANSIEIIKLAGMTLPVENKVVDIPMATTTTLGLVKASDSVRINDDGSLEVDNINVNNLTQSEGEYFVLSSGTSDQFI